MCMSMRMCMSMCGSRLLSPLSPDLWVFLYLYPIMSSIALAPGSFRLIHALNFKIGFVVGLHHQHHLLVDPVVHHHLGGALPVGVLLQMCTLLLRLVQGHTA